MEIKIDNYNIISTGTVITHDNKSVVFRINPLEFILEFKTEKDAPAKIDTHSDDKSMKIVLTNFNNSLGQGLVQPMHVGVINGKELYFQFVVYSLGDSGSKVIHYTWMDIKPEDYGTKE